MPIAGGNDILPDCNNVTKSSVIKSKLDFDERVKEWLDRAERAAASSDSESQSNSDRTKSQSEIDCRLIDNTFSSQILKKATWSLHSGLSVEFC